MENFVRDFKHTARKDFRIFFLPFTGPVQGIKKEWSNPMTENTLRASAVKGMRLFFSPLIGIALAYKAEFTSVSKANSIK